MKVHGTNHYDEHGEDIRGNLLVVEYLSDLWNDPEIGKENLDMEYIERAKELVTRTLDKPYTIELTVPELVVRVHEEA